MGKIDNLKVYCKKVYDKTEMGVNKKLLEGDYYDRHFVIIRHKFGSPDAYIEVKPDDWINKAEPSEYGKSMNHDDRYEKAGLWVNGGPTYFGDAYWDSEDKRTYIGWDYAHCDDYDPQWELSSGKEDSGHKWSMIEIMMDVAHAYEGMERDNFEHWSGGDGAEANKGT